VEKEDGDDGYLGDLCRDTTMHIDARIGYSNSTIGTKRCSSLLFSVVAGDAAGDAAADGVYIPIYDGATGHESFMVWYLDYVVHLLDPKHHQDTAYRGRRTMKMLTFSTTIPTGSKHRIMLFHLRRFFKCQTDLKI
jgi:hypothetical protein